MSTSRFIQVTSGENVGGVFALGDSTILGRSPQSNVQVMDPQVSRKHACLELTDEGHTVLRDLASANGTYVRDNPITEQRLRSGDTFRVGSTEFVFGEVRGDVVDSPSMKRVVKPTFERSERAMRQTILIDDSVDTMVGAAGRARNRGRAASAGGRPHAPRRAGTCGDPMHHVARSKGWAHCPACGGKITPQGIGLLGCGEDEIAVVVEGDRCGWSVSGPGDVNGDGVVDLVIGAPAMASNGLEGAGRTYVVFGGDFSCDGR